MIRKELIDQIKNNIGAITPIMEPITDCNLDCSYCFVGDKKHEKMNYTTLESIMAAVINHNGKNKVTKFIWHGGEPLLMGLEFYKKVIKIQRKFTLSGYRIFNAIQSNLTLLNDEYIDFFKEHEFGVGTSLDGIKEIHNHNRCNTFKLVLSKIKYAKSQGLHVGVICVLTKELLNRISEIYDFFKTNEIDFTLSPVIPNKRYSDSIITPLEYYTALKHLFDLWYFDESCSIRINPCNSVIQSILLKGTNLSCIHSENCINHFLTFLPDGSVYPCNRFTDYNQFNLGNINDHSLQDILKSEVRIKILERNTTTIAACTDCDFKHYCKGGCMSHAFEFYGTIYERDYYCQAFFNFFTYIKNNINQSLKKAKYGKVNF